MESQYQKYVNMSYAAVAIILGYVVFAFGAKFIGIYDLALSLNEQSNQFMNEVMVELSRVTWPTQKETTSATVVVLIMVVISGVVLGMLDYLWTTLLKWIL
jgi:preprotein translocase subunit SecE